VVKRYLVTGAAGFLGRTIAAELLARGAEVYALILKDDPLAAFLPDGVAAVIGDVCDEASLAAFFQNAKESSCVIHCAGVVSVASNPGERHHRVHVDGTRNILKLCSLHRVSKLVYVSSVHAIPEQPKGTVMAEPQVLSPELVLGEYAKSKAMATRLVMEAAAGGLNASVVFPSGMIGPGDHARGSITYMLSSFLSGKLPLAVDGGYDFVDVRDAAKGVVACAERGLPGQGYILSGHYAAIRDILKIANEVSNGRRPVHCLPLCLAGLIAPFYERYSLRRGNPLYFTPYSVSVLAANGQFSCQAAAERLGYAPRPLRATLRDTVLWLQGQTEP